MAFSERERAYLETARVGRLAIADARGRPNVVPSCFALVGDDLVSPLDEKPKETDARSLRRVRDVETNEYVAAVFDDYSEDWSELRWLQVRGQAALVSPRTGFHRDAIASLREKYDQYESHAIEDHPVIRITPGHVQSWQLD